MTSHILIGGCNQISYRKRYATTLLIVYLHEKLKYELKMNSFITSETDGVDCSEDGCVAESEVFRLYGDRHLQGYYRLHFDGGEGGGYTLYVFPLYCSIPMYSVMIK